MTGINALMEQGMRTLVETLGEVDAERFIVQLLREPFDYTQWRRGAFPETSPEECNRQAAAFARANRAGAKE